MRLHRHVLATMMVLSATLTAGCSDGDKSEPRSSDASVKHREQRPAEREDVAASPDADPDPEANHSDGNTAPGDAGAAKDATAPGDAGAAKDAATSNPLGELPAGSSEHDGIVNLVDPAAAAQLETFLSTPRIAIFALHLSSHPRNQRPPRCSTVVASAQPASTEVLDDVAKWAAAFGNRGTSPVVTAFEQLTGARATVDTQIGPRRLASDPVPEPRKGLTCNVLAQDCPRPELACYGVSIPICALSAHVAKGATCDSAYACEAGLDCFSTTANPDAFACAPYCEPDDTTHAKACQTLCSGTFVRLRDSQQNTLGAFCAP